jgi:hypothetical protein
MTNNYDWRFENSITFNKKYEDTEGIIDHKYSAWRTNGILSNYVDTIMYANEMNMNASLDNKLQYDFLFYSVKAKKRFFKKKKTENDTNLELIKEYYKYNNERAKEALSILSGEQIKQIKMILEKGGIKNERSRKID